MTNTPAPPRPDQTLLGMLVAGAITALAYLLNHTIAQKIPIPVLTDNASLADKLAALVRTVIVALTTGAVMVFGIITVGLLLLTLQYLWQRLRPNP
ncbi:MAG: DUF3082 domain-containing protein [Pseudanabaenaceae cyanobacterium]